MKSLLILSISLVSLEVLSAQRTFFLKFKGESDEEVLEIVDKSIEGVLNGKLKYPHMPLRMLYESKGCWPHKESTIDLLGLTVKKAYRINRFTEVETFQQGILKVRHKRCHNN